MVQAPGQLPWKQVSEFANGMDILEQVKAMLSTKTTEPDDTSRELLQALLRQHDAYLAARDWEGAYLALKEIVRVAVAKRRRGGVAPDMAGE